MSAFDPKTCWPGWEDLVPVTRLVIDCDLSAVPDIVTDPDAMSIMGPRVNTRPISGAVQSPPQVVEVCLTAATLVDDVYLGDITFADGTVEVDAEITNRMPALVACDIPPLPSCPGDMYIGVITGTNGGVTTADIFAKGGSANLDAVLVRVVGPTGGVEPPHIYDGFAVRREADGSLTNCIPVLIHNYGERGMDWPQSQILGVGSVANVFPGVMFNRNDTPPVVVVWYRDERQSFPIRITGRETGAGKYAGKCPFGKTLGFTTSLTDDTDLLNTPFEGIPVPLADNCVVINAHETIRNTVPAYNAIEQLTHQIPLNTTVLATVIGLTAEATPRWVLLTHYREGDFSAAIGTSNPANNQVTFLEMEWSGTAWGLRQGGRQGAAVESNGRKGIPSGTIVTMRQQEMADGSGYRYVFEKDQGDQGGDLSVVLSLSSSETGGCSSDNGEWSREDQGNKRGVTATFVWRVCIDPGTCDADDFDAFVAPVLTVYTRDATMDADGHWVFVSQETAAIVYALPAAELKALVDLAVNESDEVVGTFRRAAVLCLGPETTEVLPDITVTGGGGGGGTAGVCQCWKVRFDGYGPPKRVLLDDTHDYRGYWLRYSEAVDNDVNPTLAWFGMVNSFIDETLDAPVKLFDNGACQVFINDDADTDGTGFAAGSLYVYGVSPFGAYTFIFCVDAISFAEATTYV